MTKVWMSSMLLALVVGGMSAGDWTYEFEGELGVLPGYEWLESQKWVRYLTTTTTDPFGTTTTEKKELFGVSSEGFNQNFPITYERIMLRVQGWWGVFVGGALTVIQGKSGPSSEWWSFNPFQLASFVEGGWRNDVITIGVSHECSHPVQPWQYVHQGQTLSLDTAVTKVYARLRLTGVIGE